MNQHVLLARAYLSRVAEPAPALAELVAQVGPVAAAARVLDGRVDEQVAAETSVRRAAHRPSADLDAAARSTPHASTATVVGARASPAFDYVP